VVECGIKQHAALFYLWHLHRTMTVTGKAMRISRQHMLLRLIEQNIVVKTAHAL
jgi:hypothetical protein